MKKAFFELKSNKETSLRVLASVEANGNLLTLNYSIVNPEDLDILLPKENAQPGFKDKLYSRTCFEFFWQPRESIPEGLSYIEWNFSPSLDWAAWPFSAYREANNTDLSTAFYCPKTSFQNNSMQATITLKDSGFIQKIDFEVCGKINLSAVIELESSEKLYFAINPNQSKPDFHKLSLFEEF